MANNPNDLSGAPVLLMTRPQKAAERFVAELDPNLRDAANIVYSPVLEIKSTGAVPVFDQFSGFIFSSAQVFGFLPAGQGRTCFCVGAQTAAQARTCGWRVAGVFDTAEQLVAGIETTLEPLLHISGLHRRGEIAERLTAKGIRTEVTVVYRQDPKDLSVTAHEVLSSGVPVVLPVFSPRSAQILAASGANLVRCHLIVMSPAVAEPLEEKRVGSLIVLPAPRGDQMRKAVENMLRDPTLP